MPFKENSNTNNDQENSFDPLEYDKKQLELKEKSLKELADLIHKKPSHEVSDKKIAEYVEKEKEIEKKRKALGLEDKEAA